VLLLAFSLYPYLTHMSRPLYLIEDFILGLVYQNYDIILYICRDDGLPMRTFIYSIYYLMALFSALLVDHYLLLLW
jgi:protoheme IX farnesyltransferase